MSLSHKQENNKEELNNIIDLLNNAFDRSDFLNKNNKIDKNNLQFKIIETQIDSKNKELTNLNSQIKLYKKQFEILNAKVNEKFTADR